MRPAWALGLLIFFSSVECAWTESLSFEICGQSSEWVRPAPEVQAKIWNDNRYKDFAKDSYPWLHEPVKKGFQIIRFRRLNPSVVVRFVTPEGKELQRWDESAPPGLSNVGPANPVRR